MKLNTAASTTSISKTHSTPPYTAYISIAYSRTASTPYKVYTYMQHIRYTRMQYVYIPSTYIAYIQLAYVHMFSCFQSVFFAHLAYLSRSGEQDRASSSSLLAQWLSQPNAFGVRLAKALCFQVCARLNLASFLALPKKTAKKKDDVLKLLPSVII